MARRLAVVADALNLSSECMNEKEQCTDCNCSPQNFDPQVNVHREVGDIGWDRHTPEKQVHKAHIAHRKPP